MAATVPRFNRATFQILDDAAKLIDFPKHLLRLDERKHFEDLFSKLQATENEYTPTQYDIIEKAITKLGEKLVATATPPLAATDESSTVANAGGQVGNGHDDVGASLGTSAQSPSTDDEVTLTPATSEDNDLENTRHAEETSTTSGIPLPSHERFNHSVQINSSTSTASQAPAYSTQASTHASQAPTSNLQAPTYNSQAPENYLQALSNDFQITPYDFQTGPYGFQAAPYGFQAAPYASSSLTQTNYANNHPTVPNYPPLNNRSVIPTGPQAQWSSPQATNHVNWLSGDAEPPYHQTLPEPIANYDMSGNISYYPPYTSGSASKSFEENSSTFDIPSDTRNLVEYGESFGPINSLATDRSQSQPVGALSAYSTPDAPSSSESSYSDAINEETLAVVQPVTNGTSALAMSKARQSKARKSKAKTTAKPRGISKRTSEARTSGSRQVHGRKVACLKCQTFKKICVSINPDDPDGPCEACVLKPDSIYSVWDCSKQDLRDLVMYRGGKGSQFTSEPLRLSLPRLASEAREINSSSPIWFIEIQYERGLVRKSIRAQARGFILTSEEANAQPGSAEAFYKDHPYRLCDPAPFFLEFQDFSRTIARQQTLDLRKENDWTRLDKQIFRKAFEVADRHPKPEVRMLIQGILDFWTMARMYEGGWTLSSSETPISKILTNTDVTEVHYIDHQLAWTIKRALETLCKFITGKQLKELYISTADADHWMPKFLATYLLLHHWEMLMQQQARVAHERKVPQRFSNVVLLDHVTSSARNILDHYHYHPSNKAKFEIDWENSGMPKISDGFDEAERKFLVDIANEVTSKREHIRRVCEAQHWDEALSLTGMLFDCTTASKLQAR